MGHFDIYKDNRVILNDEIKDTILKMIYYIKGLEHKLDTLHLDDSENNEKRQIINELLNELLNEDLTNEEKLNILNRLLLVLGLEPFTQEFYNILFNNVNFKDVKSIKDVTHKFRCLCLLEFGRFRGGYRKFINNPQKLKDAIQKYFPDEDERRRRRKIFENPRRKIVGFKVIPPEFRFCLGYLARKEFPDVSESRKILGKLLEKARNLGVEDYDDLINKLKMSGEKINEKDFEELIKRSSIPHALEKIVYHKIHYPDQPYIALLTEIIQRCKIEDSKVIEDIRRMGKENTYAYLSCREIDVYFATSMRRREDFELNYKFIEKLMNHDEIKDLNILYFDPTQSYVEDRVQKGLIECIMIKRGKVTIYNAQEEETFGKVAEATLTLAHGKPVIIYIPRILENYNNKIIQKIYKMLDNIAFYDHVTFLEELKKEKLITEEDFDELKSPEKEKIDVIEKLANKFEEQLYNIDFYDILKDLHDKGLQVPKNKSPIEFAKERFIRFERTALIFKDLHPLMFQISSVDGVSRGVFVARTVDQVAKLLKGLLIKGLNYKIEKLGNNIALFDEITHSPIRVTPDDDAIRIALALEAPKID